MTPAHPALVYVIGMGEVGRRLAGALARTGCEVVPVTRDSGWQRAETDADGVRLVCVREESLESVLERLRGVPGDRIAVIQNGWIRPLLGRLAGVTRGLIWFTSKGEFFEVLRPSPFQGPLAAALASALTSAGIPATAHGREEFDRLDADKMGFNCVVGLPLAVHAVSLAEYLDRHAVEARALHTESVTVCADAIGARVDDDGWQRFVESVRPIGWVRAATAKALEFRNLAVVRLAAERGLPAPVTERLLAAADGLR